MAVTLDASWALDLALKRPAKAGATVESVNIVRCPEHDVADAACQAKYCRSIVYGSTDDRPTSK